MKRYHRPFGLIMAPANIISFILGIIYWIAGAENICWNIYGFLMLAVFSGNIILAYAEENHKWLGYLYLALTTIFMLAAAAMNLLASTDPINRTSQSMVSITIVYSLFVMGVILSVSNLQPPRSTKAPSCMTAPTRKTRIRKTTKAMLIYLLSISLCIGMWVSYQILSVDISGVSDLLIPHFSLFYAYVFLSIGVLILKLLKASKAKAPKNIVFIASMVVFAICMLPFASVPVLLRNADKSYTAAFGNEHATNPIFKRDDFRKLKFSIPEYFFGIPSAEYTVQKHILFYEGTDGVDKDLTLYFDVYTPPARSEQLPGGNSVLIRVHGGGWVFGDKGRMNYAQMNKYFASQGYIVFDIQYGFTRLSPLYKPDIMKDIRYGDFQIDDMVGHVGKFIAYLADHQEEYGANVNSVFISGASAGGNMALALGLALSNGEYTDILDSRIRIKGLIPFYPANEIPELQGFGGSGKFLVPGVQVNENAPPCLIFQGSHDGIVKPETTDRVRAAYLEAGNKKCAVIQLLFGGHASDIYFSGYYNQVFLYYMERFMYQYR